MPPTEPARTTEATVPEMPDMSKWDELLNVPIKFWSCCCCKRPTIRWHDQNAVCFMCGNSSRAEKAESQLTTLRQQLAEARQEIERLNKLTEDLSSYCRG